MTNPARQVVLTVALTAAMAACTADPPPTAAPSQTTSPTPAATSPSASNQQVTIRGDRSDGVLASMIADDEPGCSAAVAVEGKVVWRGVRGIADLTAGKQITTKTVFDIGSVSKQFTALAILLLQEQQKLSLGDHVSDHLHGLPPWADRVTLGQLMHHTSGIPDYIAVVYKQGHSLTEPMTHEQSLRSVEKLRKLNFKPGTKFEYSNSNYLLLAEVVRHLSGQALPHYLQTNVFGPLDLSMVLDSVSAIKGKAVPYQKTNAGFEKAAARWELIGAGGIQATPTTLARWGDNYRTGRIGGPAVLAAQVKAPVPMNLGDSTAFTNDPDHSAAYGAGIIRTPSGSVVHDGTWGGFRTSFDVSPDRRTTLVVACNLQEIDSEAVAERILPYWM